MKVLLSAFSCLPGGGSEPGAGWNWVQQIIRKHEVWLITSDEYRAEIEREVPPTVHATFVPSFRRWSRLQKMPIPGLDWLYYYWWQWKVYRVARKLNEQVGFDVAHHATMGSWRVPSFLCLLPVPLIWGPIGGGGVIPPALRGQLGWKGRCFEGIRNLCQRISRWDPCVRLAMRRAARIIAANRETAELVPVSWRSKIRIMPSCGISSSEKVESVAPEQQTGEFVVLCAGVLEPRKAGVLAIRAFARLAASRRNALLVFTGRGPERERLAALAAKLGVDRQVRFLGGLPRRAQVLGWMEAADVLLFPSLRESSPVVLLEAMLAGTPVICLDQGGPGEIISADCGIKVPPGGPDEVTAALAGALEKLAGDPALCQAMGEAGRRRVSQFFDWDRRGEQMMEIYQEVVAKPGTPVA